MEILAAHVDKDGTLMDSEPRNKRVIEDVAAEYGIYSELDAEIRHEKWMSELWPDCEGQAEKKIHGILSRQFLRSEISGISAADFEAVCRRLYNERHDEVKVRPGMIQLLHELKESRTKLSLVTSSDRESTNMDFELAFGSVEAGDAFFDAVITSDDLTDSQKKPDPFPYIESCRRLNVPIDRGNIAFEDSPTGTESAMGAFGNGKNLVFRFMNDKSAQAGNEILRPVLSVDGCRTVLQEFLRYPLAGPVGVNDAPKALRENSL